MKKIIIIFIALVITTSAFSQSYRSAVGAKLGYGVELTYKTFLNSTNALDLGVSFGFFTKNYFNLTARGFYLWHFDIPVDGLSWYIGPGVYIGPRFFHYNDGIYKHHEIYFYTSINCMGGIEYKFPSAPFAISLDVTPGIRLGGGYADKVGFADSYGGVGFKYTF